MVALSTVTKSKNRVGDFFAWSLDCASQTGTQVPDCDWEITPVATIPRRSNSLTQKENDPCAGKEVSTKVSWGNTPLAPTEPSVKDQLHPSDGGLEDQTILNQNGFFEERYSGWTNAMFERASLAGQSLGRFGDTSSMDGVVLVESRLFGGNVDLYGDERQSLHEMNNELGSFSFIIDNVQASESGTSWEARVRITDNLGFDERNWQGRRIGELLGLKDSFPSRYIRRGTWYVKGDCE